MNNIFLAVNICTYHRMEHVRGNISKLLMSKFFTDQMSQMFGRMHIFVVDNGSEIPICNTEYLHIFHNGNTGGAGGFQKGLEKIRNFPVNFSHVIFMDDDVDFNVSAFYILFDYLQGVSKEFWDNPVAGRMLCADRANIQYTAAEIWNCGKPQHIEYMRDIEKSDYQYGRVVYDSGADYGGWWLCCFPMTFAKKNDILPFFLHCDDVEYGLRCGKPPVIIEGFHVWHDTYDKKSTPLIEYYDLRNTLFINDIYRLEPNPHVILYEWKEKIAKFHTQKDTLTEYYLILGMRDFIRGIDWLKQVDSEKYHKKLEKVKCSKLKNAISTRIIQKQFQKKYNLF